MLHLLVKDKIVKKIIFFCLGLILFLSCSVDDDRITLVYEFLPIESINLPGEFRIGTIYVIDYTYYKPTTCYGYFDLYYRVDENERTLAVMNVVYEESNCEPSEFELVEQTFNFSALEYDSYIFKIWQGEDENGEDVFLTYEIPVVD